MSMPTIVRPLAEPDLPALPGLLAQLGYNLPAAELARRVSIVRAATDHALLVAARGEVVLGLLHLFVRPAIEKPPEVIVQALVVDAAARHGGIGRLLMAFAEDWARERGYCSVALTSGVTRTAAHAFYAALGYEIAATSMLLRKTLAA
jgi:GNAT superfamily N-acetyltransferase